MRYRIFATFAAIVLTVGSLTDEARATTVVLPAGISEIIGNFPSDPLQGVFIPISIENIAPIPYLAGPWPTMPFTSVNDVRSFVLDILVSGSFLPIDFHSCASNIPGPGACGMPIAAPGSGVSITEQFPTISVRFEARILVDGQIEGFDATPYYSVLAELPDGLSVAAVPESSTWAMLLIGFAAMGFAGYPRNRRR